MECYKKLGMDIRKIKTLPNLTTLIDRFIEYELYLAEFHLTLFSQTMRRWLKVFNQPSSFSRNRDMFSLRFIPNGWKY